jgi:hypothetical protein
MPVAEETASDLVFRDPRASARGSLGIIMKKIVLITLLLAITSLSVPGDVFAMMHHGKGRHMGRYGGYCKGPRWGWYGAGRQVKTEEEVRELVTEFLDETDLVTGEIQERETYYEIEVKDEGGEVIDLLIVDKRTCRIRSAY